MGSTWATLTILLLTVAAKSCAWVPCKLSSQKPTFIDLMRYRLCFLNYNEGKKIRKTTTTTTYIDSSKYVKHGGTSDSALHQGAATVKEVTPSILCQNLSEKRCQIVINDFNKWIKLNFPHLGYRVTLKSYRSDDSNNRNLYKILPLHKTWISTYKKNGESWKWRQLPSLSDSTKLFLYKLIKASTRHKRNLPTGNVSQQDLNAALERYREWRRRQGYGTGKGRWGR